MRYISCSQPSIESIARNIETKATMQHIGSPSSSTRLIQLSFFLKKKKKKKVQNCTIVSHIIDNRRDNSFTTRNKSQNYETDRTKYQDKATIKSLDR